jgi:hypothetical protein
MSLRTKSTWILAGLAIMAVISADASVAQAGSVAVQGSITPLPGGSPWLYEFELILNDLQSGPITSGATLTVGTPSPGVSGLVGVTPQSGTQQPPTTGGSPTDVWIVPPGGIVTTGTGNAPPFDKESSVTWNYFSGNPYSQVGNVGLFTVETATDFPDNTPPIIPGVTLINYTFTFANGTVSSGDITLSLVPEPSTVIMLLVGLGGLPLLRKWARPSRLARVK